MNDTQWKLDAALVANIEDNLISADDAFENSTLDILEGIGTLTYAGAKSQAKKIMETHLESSGSKMVTMALAGIDPEELEDASLELPRLLIELTDSDEKQQNSLCDEVTTLLGVRDKIELCIAGAKTVLGRDPELDVELESSIDAFDQVLEPLLWRTVVMGERRLARVAWVHPDYRCKMWWWSRGTDISSSAVESLKTTASLVAAFPEVQQELDTLLKVEQTFSKLITPSVTSNVTSIVDFLKEKRREKEDVIVVPDGKVRVAAASEEEEQLVFTNSDVEISTSGTYLNIDRVGSLDDHKEMVARFVVEGQEALVARKPMNGRFQFSLDEPHFQRERGLLEISWDEGSVQIPIPFEEKK